MNHGIGTMIHLVGDLARVKVLYGELLGVEPYVHYPCYSV